MTSTKNKPTTDPRTLIIAIVGESGSGKTTLERHLAFFFGIRLIESYTDRPMREPNEKGHKFISENEFDAISERDMLAFTQYGSHRYCCLYSDLKKLNTYVIDENGLLMLQKLDPTKYAIKTIRVWCNEEERIRRAGKERVARDKGRFTMNPLQFDILYRSDRFASVMDDEIALYEIKNWINEFSDKKV